MDVAKLSAKVMLVGKVSTHRSSLLVGRTVNAMLSKSMLGMAVCNSYRAHAALSFLISYVV